MLGSKIILQKESARILQNDIDYRQKRAENRVAIRPVQTLHRFYITDHHNQRNSFHDYKRRIHTKLHRRETGQEAAHAIRIYDSNAEHFTLKWWSNFSNHLVFPENDWCTEFYVANSFPEKVKALFDGLTKPAPAADPEHPFYGKWYRITSVANDLDKVKEIWETLCNAEDLDKIWEILYNQKDAGKKHPGFGGIVINETHFIYSGGEILNAKSDGKGSLILHGDNPDYAYKLSAIWLPGDYAIVARPYDNKNIYELWKRVGDDVPLINHIITLLLNQ